MISYFPCSVFASTIIAAQVIRNEVGIGECQISSGFPFPAGLVTESIITQGRIKVTVDSVEVAANISALRGRHNDGTVRSALIQFVYTMAQNDTVTAQVIIDGGVRTYSDPAYIRPTYEMVENNNIIWPTSDDYLVSTQLVFRNLLAEGDGSANEESLYTALAEDRALAIASAGTASYENVSGLLALWCRTADITYQKKAVTETLAWLPYNTPLADQTPACNADTVINPDGRTPVGAQACGVPAEWQMPRALSYAQMYLLTGYRDFWGIVAYLAQSQQNAGTDITNQSTADTEVILSGEYDTPRYNYSRRYGALIAALQIDATIDVDGQYFLGRQLDWTDQLGWIVNAIKAAEWDLKWIPFDSGTSTVPENGTTISQGGVSSTLLGVYQQRFDPIVAAGEAMPASGYLQVNNVTGGSFSAGALTGISASATGAEESDYRQGIVGSRSNSPRSPNLGGETVIPIFQFTFVANFLIDYYLYIYADSQIPAMVQAILDVILTNIRLMEEGDTYYGTSGGAWGNPTYGDPYVLENPVDTDYSANPYDLPEYARLLAFVIKAVGDETVNGASYSTWYDRVIDTANISPTNILIWTWKNFGQFYAWGMDAPWIMAQESITGTATMREPTYYSTIPGDTPDFGRIESPIKIRLMIGGNGVRLGSGYTIALGQ